MVDQNWVQCVMVQCDGVVIRVCTSQSINLGFIFLIESYQNPLKNGIHSFPAWHLGNVVKIKPASSLVVSLSKALNGTPPPLCGRDVAQTFWKWQLLSNCGCPVQNMAMQFAFS